MELSLINSIYYLKEYNNDADEKIGDFILSAYDGAGRTTGAKTTSNETHEYKLKSAIIFDGNELPTEKAAVFSRMILISVNSQTFTDEQTENFKLLEALQDSGGAACNVTREILQHREHFEKNFKNELTKIINYLKNLPEFKDQNLTSRTIEQTAMILAAYSVLKDKLKFGFDFKTLLSEVIQNTLAQNAILKDVRPINVFWEAFNYYASKEPRQLKERFDYIKEVNAYESVLSIRFDNVFVLYALWCKNNKIRQEEKNSLKRLLIGTPCFKKPTQKNRSDSENKRFGSVIAAAYMFNIQYDAKDNTTKINGIDLNI